MTGFVVQGHISFWYYGILMENVEIKLFFFYLLIATHFASMGHIWTCMGNEADLRVIMPWNQQGKLPSLVSFRTCVSLNQRMVLVFFRCFSLIRSSSIGWSIREASRWTFSLSSLSNGVDWPQNKTKMIQSQSYYY